MSQKFASVINCMDGRIQTCVNEYVRNTQKVDYVDTITLAGPCKIISKNEKYEIIENLKFRLDISINNHGSEYIAIVGHFDCAGVPENDEIQKEYILHSSKLIKTWFQRTKVEALWVNDRLEVIVLK